MAVILNLPPAVEPQLQERATRIGTTLEEYLQRLAVRDAEGSEAALAGRAITYAPGFSSPGMRNEGFGVQTNVQPLVALSPAEHRTHPSSAELG